MNPTTRTKQSQWWRYFESTLFLKEVDGKFVGNGWYNPCQLVVQKMADVVKTVDLNIPHRKHHHIAHLSIIDSRLAHH
jgi:hypothetical protein